VIANLQAATYLSTKSISFFQKSST